MKRKTVFLCVAVAVMAHVCFAVDFAKVLLPIVIQTSINGAFGSVWSSRFTISNPTDASVFVRGYDMECPATCVSPSYINPHVTFSPRTFELDQTVPGLFVQVERDSVDSLNYELRVQDLSRQSQTWGTEIPVVKESDALARMGQLLDVPLSTGFRAMLRIYDFAPAPGHTVSVRFVEYDPNATSNWNSSSRVLAQRTYALSVPSKDGIPGFAAEADLGSLPELVGHDRIRIEMVPSAGVRYWAFVSVTNNATQHVTVISPH